MKRLSWRTIGLILMLGACAEPFAPDPLAAGCASWVEPGRVPLLYSRADSNGVEVERRLLACLTRDDVDRLFPPS